ncbi:MAG TPA: hypothetical protein VMC85_11560 [Desulfomonilaceae bacterium]|nr:hypothetical protein [Desulfomonilaceae bacterium]
MKVDKTVDDLDLASVPAEFRENYRFLCELINCRQKNSHVTECLEQVVEKRLCNLRGKLSRRQLQILTRFLKGLEGEESDLLAPPVPPELEASLRLRKRSTWLPWEAEAIRKIERWRADVSYIAHNWGENLNIASSSTAARRTDPLRNCR